MAAKLPPAPFELLRLHAQNGLLCGDMVSLVSSCDAQESVEV